MAANRGKGLSREDALRLLAHISASEANKQAFEASPRQVFTELGIDADAAMGGCDVDTALTLPSLKEMRDAREALTGKVMTMHSADTVHHVVR